jgi:hypothetical protein
MVAKPNSLSRSLPPKWTVPPLTEYDKDIIRTLEQRFQIPFEGVARDVLQLSTRLGGVGFSPSAEAAPHAFVAGMAASFATQLPVLNAVADKGFEAIKETASCKALDEQLRLYRSAKDLEWEKKKKMLNVGDFLRHFWGQKDASHKLQSHIVGAYRSARRKETVRKATPEERKRLESRANRSTALVWKAYPLVREMRLNDEETRFLLAYATGATLPGLPQQCSCRVNKLTLEHAVTCGTEKLTRHNMLQARLVAFAREQGVTVEQNRRLTVEDAKECQEPDIIFHFGAHRPLETDVTVVNPCAPSKLNRKRPAGEEAGQAKRRKYEQQAEQRGHRFAPLAFETHGEMSDDVISLIGQFAANTPSGVGYAATAMQMDLALTLVRGNAHSAQRVIARASRGEWMRRNG